MGYYPDKNQIPEGFEEWTFSNMPEDGEIVEAAYDYATEKTKFRKDVLKEVDADNYVPRHSDSMEDFQCGAKWQSNQIFTVLPPMDKPIVLIYGDGGEDDYDIGHHTGLNYVNKMGQQVDEHVIGWIPIPKIN